jgi:hypothetical protein
LSWWASAGYVSDRLLKGPALFDGREHALSAGGPPDVSTDLSLRGGDYRQPVRLGLWNKGLEEETT